ncbi:MAG: AAA family ATPase [Candidatus Woesearchaeota archaeon]
MKLIIGLTGTMNSGKGTVAELIESHGFEHFILSKIIKEETATQYLTVTRENLQDMGDKLRKEHGLGALAKLAFECSKTDKVLIDGIRNPGEIDFLKEHGRFFLVAVDAPIELRYQRAQERKSEKDSVSFEQFIHDDERDLGINQPGNGQQVQACIDCADAIINNISREESEARVRELMNILLR